VVDLLSRFPAARAVEAIDTGRINLFNGIPQMYVRTPK